MPNLFESIKAVFNQTRQLAQGFHVYHTPAGQDLQYRLHLRVEENGEGVLVVNASTILHLNQTATEYALGIIQDQSFDEIVKTITKRYNVPKSQAESDLNRFQDQVMTLINMPDLDPVTYLGMERQIPYTQLSAPYRLDCALTYRVSQGEDASAAPTARVERELTTEEWKAIIKKAFEVGVPHLVFTGGEPTLRADLPELLAYAEELGLVTGLQSDGLRLSDISYVRNLIANGLDHLTILLNPDNETLWQTLEHILKEDLHTTAHLTLTPGQNLVPAIDRLAKLQVNAVSLSAINEALAGELDLLSDAVAFNQLELVWDLPVPYSRWNPIALELPDAEEPKGAGNAWLYLEPDGDVLPAQGINRVLGNMLTDEWHIIWHNRSRETA